MRLKKPMYGLCDAPRAWYSEARERITKLGAIVHPLDPCLFMTYDYEAPEDTWTTQADDNGNNVKHPPLTGLFGLHVDDILGCGNMHNKSFQAFLKSLKQTFNFRTWKQATDMEYCGATIHRLHHSKCFSKLKPDGPDTQPVTDKQRTMLRATIGALQWPATQSSPHLQAMVSQLAGQVSKATLATLREANKCLRCAKSYFLLIHDPHLLELRIVEFTVGFHFFFMLGLQSPVGPLGLLELDLEAVHRPFQLFFLLPVLDQGGQVAVAGLTCCVLEVTCSHLPVGEVVQGHIHQQDYHDGEDSEEGEVLVVHVVCWWFCKVCGVRSCCGC